MSTRVPHCVGEPSTSLARCGRCRCRQGLPKEPGGRGRLWCRAESHPARDKWSHPLLLNDSLYYAAQAQQLAHGVWFREVFVDQPGAEHGPLTSTLMALVSWGSDPFNRQRMVTVACGVATVAVIGLVGRRVGGNRAGLIAAAIAALYPNLWLSDGLVMSESVSCLLSLSRVGHVGVGRPARRCAARSLSVLAVGLGTLARSEVILFVPCAAAVMWIVGRRSGLQRPWSHVLAAAAVAIALLLPWTIFNLVRFENRCS